MNLAKCYRCFRLITIAGNNSASFSGLVSPTYRPQETRGPGLAFNPGSIWSTWQMKLVGVNG